MRIWSTAVLLLRREVPLCQGVLILRKASIYCLLGHLVSRVPALLQLNRFASSCLWLTLGLGSLEVLGIIDYVFEHLHLQKHVFPALSLLFDGRGYDLATPLLLEILHRFVQFLRTRGILNRPMLALVNIRARSVP